MKYYGLLILTSICVLHACQTEQKQQTMPSEMYTKVASTTTPDATKKPKELTIHDHTRTDDYYWLNERSNPEVISYLEAENTYRSDVMSHLKTYEDKLFEELKGRIKQTDLSVPTLDNGYYYITKNEEGKEYPIYVRKKTLDASSQEEILLDVNVLAEPYDYYNVADLEVSPDNKILVYGEDTLSRRIYTLRFKNLVTGELYPESILNTEGYGIWGNDNKTVFYITKDLQTLRGDKIWRHTLGTDPANDVMIWHESDDTFSPFIFNSKSKKYLIQGSFQTLSTEFRILEADNPTGTFRTFQPRERDLEYSIEHAGDKWYVKTNLDAKNFRLMECPEGKTAKTDWKEVIPNRTDVLLEEIDVFTDYLVLSERIKGIRNLRVMPTDGSEHYIDFGEDAYVAYTGTNNEMQTDVVRISYQSMTTPSTIYDYNMRTKERKLMKQTEVLGGFDPANYKSKRIYATARDGVKVPISLVYHKDTPMDGTSPCVLYGYGSYGASMDPSFSHTRLSLLNRGFVWAIAHIRGGEELGRQWYEDGKLLKKKNTFTDFIDSGKYLVAEKYSAPDNLFAIGGSAGGLLMGAVLNMEPSMWKGVIAAVPFVDVVTTMLDESIPLTTGEYDEWGNPNDKVSYDYMLSYSPYDNVSAQDYPAILVETGLHDSQVQYWEPAKWVAKLRDMKTDKNPLLMYCNMETGHGGASGRFKRLHDTAMEWAFLLDLAGKREAELKG